MTIIRFEEFNYIRKLLFPSFKWPFLLFFRLFILSKIVNTFTSNLTTHFRSIKNTSIRISEITYSKPATEQKNQFNFFFLDDFSQPFWFISILFWNIYVSLFLRWLLLMNNLKIIKVLMSNFQRHPTMFRIIVIWSCRNLLYSINWFLDKLFYLLSPGILLLVIVFLYKNL